MADFAVPRVYLPPYGGPLYWMDERSGVLRAAVEAFLKWEEGAPAPAGFAVVLEYVRYWLDAPCWADDPEGTLARLRAELAAPGLGPAGLLDVLHQALDLGIDPF